MPEHKNTVPAWQAYVALTFVAIAAFFSGFSVSRLSLPPEEGPVSQTYAQRVMTAVDDTQEAAWEVAQANPSDAMMQWYTDINQKLSTIECELMPQECN